MPRFSVRFNRSFRFYTEAESGEVAAEKIWKASHEFDYPLLLWLGEKMENHLDDGTTFEDFFAHAEVEKEIKDDDDEEEGEAV